MIAELVHPRPLADVPPIRMPTFRAVWLGLVFMSSGVQFYAIAITWLVLQLTGSSAQLGTILAVAAVPRAITMLISGAIIDRTQPRQLLVFTALGNGVIVALLSALLAFDGLTLVILAGAGALMGLMDAFFYPTSFSLIPRIVHPTRMAQANALMQGADGFINMVAPALSGFVVALFGLPLALTFNAILFLTGALFMRGLGHVQLSDEATDTTAPSESRLQAVLNGFRYVLRNPALRWALLAIAALNFAAIGPIIVGGAVLVQGRFDGGAEMYGVFLASFGIGGLIGALIAASLPAIRRPGRVLIWTGASLGMALIAIGFTQTFWLAFAIMLAASIIVGASMPFFSAWLQQETPLAMQGRIASLSTFAAVAVDPFSQGTAGFLSQIDVTLAFGAAGGLLLLIALVVALSPVAQMEAKGIAPS